MNSDFFVGLPGYISSFKDDDNEDDDDGNGNDNEHNSNVFQTYERTTIDQVPVEIM
jgi:hypothetical protein